MHRMFPFLASHATFTVRLCTKRSLFTDNQVLPRYIVSTWSAGINCSKSRKSFPNPGAYKNAQLPARADQWQSLNEGRIAHQQLTMTRTSGNRTVK